MGTRRESMQLLEGDAEILSAPEKANGGEAGGAGFDAGLGIVGGDAADGKNGKGYQAADIAQTLDALWRAELFF